MSINGQGHSLTLVRGHSDFKVKCLTFGLYTQVSNSGPLGPLVFIISGPGFALIGKCRQARHSIPQNSCSDLAVLRQWAADFHIRKGIEDNSEIIFLINENML